MPSPDSGDSEQKTSVKSLTRRDLIARLGRGACLGSLGLAAVGMIRSYSPWVTAEPSGKFKIGAPAEYPQGTVRKFPEENVMVFRDKNGLFAISTICTHLGCVVTHTGTGFQCACHGSWFSALGELVQGPAPKGLTWLEVSLVPSGHLIVDRAKPVRFGTKLNLETT